MILIQLKYNFEIKIVCKNLSLWNQKTYIFTVINFLIFQGPRRSPLRHYRIQCRRPKPVGQHLPAGESRRESSTARRTDPRGGPGSLGGARARSEADGTQPRVCFLSLKIFNVLCHFLSAVVFLVTLQHRSKKIFFNLFRNTDVLCSSDGDTARWLDIRYPAVHPTFFGAAVPFGTFPENEIICLEFRYDF